MMTKRADMLSDKPAPLTFDEHEAKALEAAELLKKIRQVRKQAEHLDIHMISYLLNMAEIETADFIADTPRDIDPPE